MVGIFNELKCFPPIPGIVAERDRVGVCCKKFFADRLRDAEALVGGVLVVDDGKIDPPLGDAAWKASAYRFATCLPDDIADEQNGARSSP
jgi:hypothetical protein